MKALQCLLERLRDSFAALARETTNDDIHRAYRCGLSDGFNIALGLVRHEDVDAPRYQGEAR